MILAFDSSASQGSVALVQEGRVFREMTFETPRGRGGALFAALESILHAAPEIRRLVVGTGPGSYNGIRSALAAGWGIAAVRNIPLVGISSLLGLADGRYCAAGDARRGQYYFARVYDGHFEAEPVLLDREGLLEELEKFPGFPIFTPAPIAFLPDAAVCMPAAARLASIAANWQPPDEVPEPLYLKPAHITVPGGR